MLFYFDWINIASCDAGLQCWCLSCQAGALLLSACARGSANVKRSSSLCSASSELCRLILLSPFPFHLPVTAKWLSAVQRLSSGLPTDRIEEVQQYLMLSNLLNATTTVSRRLYGFWDLIWARGTRWTPSWVYKCGLFCRLHLGLHMAQQTAVREAGGHMGRAHLQWALLHLYTPTRHLRKWQTERLRDHPARQMPFRILAGVLFCP